MGCTSSVVADSVSAAVLMDPRPEQEMGADATGDSSWLANGNALTTGRTTMGTISGRKSTNTLGGGGGMLSAAPTARTPKGNAVGNGLTVPTGNGQPGDSNGHPNGGGGFSSLLTPTSGAPPGMNGHTAGAPGINPNAPPHNHSPNQTDFPDTPTSHGGNQTPVGRGHRPPGPGTRGPGGTDTRTTTPGTVGLHFHYNTGSAHHSRASSGVLLGAHNTGFGVMHLPPGMSGPPPVHPLTLPQQSHPQHQHPQQPGGHIPGQPLSSGPPGSRPQDYMMPPGIGLQPTSNLLTIPQAGNKPAGHAANPPKQTHYVIIQAPPPPPPRPGSPQTLVLKVPPYFNSARSAADEDREYSQSRTAAYGGAAGVGPAQPPTNTHESKSARPADQSLPPTTLQATVAARPFAREAVRATLLDSAFGMSPAGPRVPCEVCFERLPKGQIAAHTRTHIDVSRAGYVQQLRSQLAHAFGFGVGVDLLPAQAALLRSLLNGIVDYCLVPTSAPPHAVWHDLPPRLLFDEAAIAFSTDLLRALPVVVRFHEYLESRPEFGDAYYLVYQCLPLYLQFLTLAAKLQIQAKAQGLAVPRLCPNAAIDVWWQSHLLRPAAYARFCLVRFGVVVAADRDICQTDPLTQPTPNATAQAWQQEYGTTLAVPTLQTHIKSGDQALQDPVTVTGGLGEGLISVTAVLSDRLWLSGLRASSKAASGPTPAALLVSLSSPKASPPRSISFLNEPDLKCSRNHPFSVEYTRPAVLVAGGTEYIPSRSCVECRQNVYAIAAHWYRCLTCDDFVCRACARKRLVRCKRRGHGMTSYRGRTPPDTPPSPKQIDLLSIPNYRDKLLAMQTAAANAAGHKNGVGVSMTPQPSSSATSAGASVGGSGMSYPPGSAQAALQHNVTMTPQSVSTNQLAASGAFGLNSGSPIIGTNGIALEVGSSGVSLGSSSASSPQLPSIMPSPQAPNGTIARAPAPRPPGTTTACDHCGDQTFSARSDWYHCEMCGDADACENCADQCESYLLYALKQYRRFWFFARRFPETARIIIGGARLPVHIDLMWRVHQLQCPAAYAVDCARDIVLLPDHVADTPLRGDDRTERARREVAKRYWADTFGAEAALF